MVLLIGWYVVLGRFGTPVGQLISPVSLKAHADGVLVYDDFRDVKSYSHNGQLDWVFDMRKGLSGSYVGMEVKKDTIELTLGRGPVLLTLHKSSGKLLQKLSVDDSHYSQARHQQVSKYGKYTYKIISNSVVRESDTGRDVVFLENESMPAREKNRILGYLLFPLLAIVFMRYKSRLIPKVRPSDQ